MKISCGSTRVLLAVCLLVGSLSIACDDSGGGAKPTDGAAGDASLRSDGSSSGDGAVVAGSTGRDGGQTDAGPAGSGGASDAGSFPDGGTAGGSVAMKVDGVDRKWQTQKEVLVLASGNLITIMGSANQLTVTIVIPNTAGAYQCTGVNGAALSYGTMNPASSYNANGLTVGSSCTVTISEVGAAGGGRIKGTFAGTLKKASGMGADMVTVTEGQFDVAR